MGTDIIFGFALTKNSDLINLFSRPSETSICKVWKQKPDQIINYKLFYGPDGMLLQPDGTISWTPNPVQVDSVKYAVIASHGVATDTQFVALFVNHPPIINKTPPMINPIDVGETWEFDLNIEDPNKNDILVFYTILSINTEIKVLNA